MSLNSFNRFVKNYLLQHAFSLVFLIVINIIWSISGPISVYILQNVVDYLGNFSFPIVSIILFLVLKTISDVGNIIIFYFQNKFSNNFSSNLRKHFYDIISNLPRANITELTYSKVVDKFNITDSYAKSLLNPLMLTINFLLSIGISVYFVMQMNIRMLLVLCVPLPVWAVLIIYINKLLNKYTNAQSVSNSEKYETLLSFLGHVESIITFNKYPYERIKYVQIHDKNLKNILLVNKTQKTENAVNLFLTQIPLVTILILLITVFKGNNSDLIAVYMIIGYIYQPFINIEGIWTAFIDISIKKKRLKEILNYKPETSGIIKYIGTNEIAYELSNITFSYTNNGRSIFENINLKIYKNECVAIVGQSGCGKSTLINILLGLLKPLSGKIIVDGILLTQMDISSYHKKVSYMNQRPTIFSVSVKDNILLGSNDITDDCLFKVCQSINIHNEICKMKGGYDAILYENGKNLSGGQAQRIELARCLVKNSDIFIFDEPTSSIDFYNEDIICNTIKKLKNKKTIIIISHREKLLTLADKTYGIEDRKLIQSCK